MKIPGKNSAKFIDFLKTAFRDNMSHFHHSWCYYPTKIPADKVNIGQHKADVLISLEVK